MARNLCSNVLRQLKHRRLAANSFYRQYSTRPEVGQSSCLTDFGTRRIFSEEHDIFRQSVRRFFHEEVLPNHSKWEKEGQVSREVWEKAGAQGILGITTPAEHGGIGGDQLSTAITWEEQAYVNCSGPGFALHSDIVMPYISHFGTPEQIEKYIPNMTAGKCIGAIAMTEPGAGSDLQGVRTNAKKDGDDWILNGSKVFITNGYMADVVVVVAITDTGAKSAAHGISLFLVDAGTKGFIKGRKLEKLGFKAQVQKISFVDTGKNPRKLFDVQEGFNSTNNEDPDQSAPRSSLINVFTSPKHDTAELFFEDVRLPSSALLGKANNGFYYLMQELPQERLIIADFAQAACEWMFEETRTYVKQRKAFGKTISNLQTIQHRLAELKSSICVGRAFVDQCLEIHNEKGLDSETASMAKYWCSELQNKVATECLQMHGGWGYMWEYPIARAFVDARLQMIYGGSNEIMKELIARKIVSG